MADEITETLTLEEVEDRILSFIESELLGPGDSVGRDEDLLTGERFDSIGVLRLASFVDERFEIGMQPSDFVIENFQNVTALARYVLRAKSES